MFKIRAKLRFFHYLCSILLLIFFIIYPLFMHSNLKNGNINIFDDIHQQSAFLKVWNIDDFEGGSGNRTGFLESVAKQFGNKNKGVYIIVQNLSSSQAFNALINGTMPDLISFSHHSGYMLKNVLKDYNGSISVREDIISYAMLDNAIKAVPWYLSGYCLIGNKEIEPNLSLSCQTMYSYNILGQNAKPSVSVGLANNGFALLAAIKNDAQIAGTNNIISNFDTTTTFQAYNDFCSKKSATILLGTARDFYRVHNKVELGLMQCDFKPLGSFTDLIGYMGICKMSPYATEFIEFLTSPMIQNQLKNIGLFSTTFDEIYADNEFYSAFEKVLQRKIKSINIFMDKAQKDELWKQSINATFGNNDSLNYIKKYI